MKRKIPWQTKLLLLLALLTLIGFIQWETWFPLEIKNETLQKIADGGLGFGALFLFLAYSFIILLGRIKGLRRVILSFIFLALLLFIGYMGAIFIAVGRLVDWGDQYVYQNGNDYLIVEALEGPEFVEWKELRLIRTSSPGSMVRWIEATYPIDKNKKAYTKGSDEITFAGKKWKKIELEEGM